MRLQDDRITQSRPCIACVEWLVYFKIKKVIYSDGNGDMVEKRICDIVNEEQHINSGRKFLERMGVNSRNF